MIRRTRLPITFLLLLFVASQSFAYTETPGPRKGVFWRDQWGRTWFLRASAIIVSKSVAKQAKQWLGRPVVFKVSAFDTTYIPREYRRGTIATDSSSELKSANVVLSTEFHNDNLRVRIKYKGKESFIVRDSVMIAVFFAPLQMQFNKPHPRQILLKQLVSQKEQPRLKSGEAKTYQIATSELRKRLNLPVGKHQLMASYFNDGQEVRVVSGFLELNIKDNPQQSPRGDSLAPLVTQPHAPKNQPPEAEAPSEENKAVNLKAAMADMKRKMAAMEKSSSSIKTVAKNKNPPVKNEKPAKYLLASYPDSKKMKIYRVGLAHGEEVYLEDEKMLLSNLRERFKAILKSSPNAAIVIGYVFSTGERGMLEDKTDDHLYFASPPMQPSPLQPIMRIAEKVGLPYHVVSLEIGNKYAKPIRVKTRDGDLAFRKVFDLSSPKDSKWLPDAIPTAIPRLLLDKGFSLKKEVKLLKRKSASGAPFDHAHDGVSSEYAVEYQGRRIVLTARNAGFFLIAKNLPPHRFPFELFHSPHTLVLAEEHRNALKDFILKLDEHYHRSIKKAPAEPYKRFIGVSLTNRPFTETHIIDKKNGIYSHSYTVVDRVSVSNMTRKIVVARLTYLLDADGHAMFVGTKELVDGPEELEPFGSTTGRGHLSSATPSKTESLRRQGKYSDTFELLYLRFMAEERPAVKLDLSTPQKAYHHLQKALKDRNEKKLLQLVSTWGETSKSHVIFVHEIVEKFPQDRDMDKADGLSRLLARGKIVRVVPTKAEPDEDGNEFERCQVWLLSKKDNLYGNAFFIKHDKAWKFISLFEDVVVIRPYAFSTPKKAFLSLAQAMKIDDCGGIYENIDPRLRKGVTLKEYAKAVQEADDEDDPDLRDYDEKHLEVESIDPDKNGRKRKKVWGLNKKREAYEIFVKNGKEWKWVPKKEYSWYPKKPKGKGIKESN